MINVMRSSQTQLQEPLILIITTVGFNLNYPIFTKEYPFAKKVLEGEVEADDYLALIWELDDPTEINNPDLWIKSNPILEVESLRPVINKFLSGELETAKAKRDMAPVLVKNFNLWQNASANTFIDWAEWEKCELQAPPLLDSREVFIGVDLAYTNDLAAVSFAVPIKEEEYFYVNSHVFVVDPIERAKRDRIDYVRMIETGSATACDGFIDTTNVAQFIIDFLAANKLECKGIFYDPAHGADFRNYLIREGYDEQLIMVRQGPITLSPAALSFREDVFKQKVRHYNASSLSLGIKNAIEKRINDAVLIDKSKQRDKIDSLAALINIWTEVPYYEFEEKLSYLEEDFSF